MHGGHIFGRHAFGMPVFSAPTIPTIAAGRLGPSFNERPTPAGFPGASVRGFGAETVNFSDAEAGVFATGGARSIAATYNDANCGRLGWAGSVRASTAAPYLTWAPGAGESNCGSETLARAVVNFQMLIGGLAVDGKLGPRTLARLQKRPGSLPPPDNTPGGEGDPKAVAVVLKPGDTPKLPAQGGGYVEDTTPWYATPVAKKVLIVGGVGLMAVGLWLAFGKKGASVVRTPAPSLYLQPLGPGF